MSVIDFHSHILPEIDDGSRNVETSIGMLRMCREQGVDIMIATPHFYADSNRVERFVENRKNAYDKVMAENADIPHIMMGAEVAFFDGISRAERVDALTIEGTNIMLLEMPFVTWSDSRQQLLCGAGAGASGDCSGECGDAVGFPAEGADVQDVQKRHGTHNRQ